MNGASGQFPYMNQPNVAVAAPHLCNHRSQWVDPRHVQYQPDANDLPERSFDQFSPTLYNHFSDPVGVGINVGLTYNPGDRLFSGHHTPQDEERHWTLLQPVQEYNLHHDNATMANGEENEMWINDYGVNTDEAEAATQLMQDNHMMNLSGPAGSPAGFYSPAPDLPPYDLPVSNTQSPVPDIAVLPDGLLILEPHPLELTCEICGSTKCNTLESLKRHKVREHGGNVTWYTCLELNCRYKTKKESDIERHLDSVHLKRHKFRCPLCSKTFPRKDNCKRHLRDKEGRDDLEVVEL